MRFFLATVSTLALGLAAAISSAQAATFIGPDCGTDANRHLCVTLTQAADNNKPVVIGSLKLGSLPNITTSTIAISTALTVECVGEAKTLAQDHFVTDVLVQLTLDHGGPNFAGPSTVTYRYSVTQPIDSLFRLSQPITLSRGFKPSAANSLPFNITARAVFASSYRAQCTIRGGQTITNVTP